MIRSTNLALLLVCLCYVSTGVAETATVISDTPLYQRPSIESSILGSVKAGSQVVAVRGGEAETTDGVHWVLYAMDERIVTHTGLS